MTERIGPGVNCCNRRRTRPPTGRSRRRRVSPHATAAAASRARRLDARALRRAVAELDAAVSAVQRIGVDEPLAAEAGRLAQEHGLRGYGAVHLATALSVEDPKLVLVTWDADLARAALRCGRPVAPALSE